MVGLKTYQNLRNLGIKKIHTIQDMPIDMMQSAFGKNGSGIWRKAQGIDNTPVIQHNERKSISTERTFDHDTIDILKLKGILAAMAENLAFQLRRGKKVCACVTVKVRYSDFQTQTLQRRLPYSSADHDLIPLVAELFERLYNRRLLVRLIGVRYSDLVNGHHQMSLFDDKANFFELYQAMDKMRIRYGDRAVLRAVGMEARTIGRWNPFSGEPPPLLANRRS